MVVISNFLTLFMYLSITFYDEIIHSFIPGIVFEIWSFLILFSLILHYTFDISLYYIRVLKIIDLEYFKYVIYMIFYFFILYLIYTYKYTKYTKYTT